MAELNVWNEMFEERHARIVDFRLMAATMNGTTTFSLGLVDEAGGVSRTKLSTEDAARLGRCLLNAATAAADGTPN